MRIINRTAATLITALLIASCSTDRQDDTESSKIDTAKADGVLNQATQTYRGYAIYNDENKTFRSCDNNNSLLIIDSKNSNNSLASLYKRLAPPQQAAQELFVVIKGHTVSDTVGQLNADYSGTIQVDSILFAATEGPNCDKNWNTFQYQAVGNEPFWSVTVSEKQMELAQIGVVERSWKNVKVETNQTDNTVRYTGREASKDANASLTELTITQQACWDTMADAYYALSAVLRMDNKELLGCALQGTLEAQGK